MDGALSATDHSKRVFASMVLSSYPLVGMEMMLLVLGLGSYRASDGGRFGTDGFLGGFGSRFLRRKGLLEVRVLVLVRSSDRSVLRLGPLSLSSSFIVWNAIDYGLTLTWNG